MISTEHCCYLQLSSDILCCRILTHTHSRTHAQTHTHTQTLPFYGSLHFVQDYLVSQYQKGKTNLDFTEVAVASAGPYANLHLVLDR